MVLENNAISSMVCNECFDDILERQLRRSNLFASCNFSILLVPLNHRLAFPRFFWKLNVALHWDHGLPLPLYLARPDWSPGRKLNQGWASSRPCFHHWFDCFCKPVLPFYQYLQVHLSKMEIIQKEKLTSTSSWRAIINCHRNQRS